MNKPLRSIRSACLAVAATSLAPVPVLAQSSTPSSAAALETVVVTAQKREESYLEVPLAVTSLSGEVLDVAKVTEFQDLVQVSPSITYNQTGDQRGVGVLVRGIGTTNFQTAVEPTVSTVVDGVTMGRTVQFISDLADIERVEVLRGPQGTLFGKNASAGLLNIVTKRPASAFEASVKTTVTDDSGWGVNGALSGPITDAVRGRVAAYTKEYDGFGKNLFTGNDINGDESWGVRGKLDIDVSDDVNLYLIADYSEQERNCCTFFMEDFGGNRFYAFDYAQYGITPDEKNNKTLDVQDGFSNTETFGGSGELTVEFDNFVLTSITAYREFELETNQGIDGIPYDSPTYGRFLFNANGAFNGGKQTQDQFSQELRITSTGWDSVDLTAGLFYWDQSVDRYFEREVVVCTAPAAADTTLSPDPAITPCTAATHAFGYFNSSVQTENWAAFSQADWHFAERWTVTLGLRYTNDDIAVDFERVTPNPGPAVPASAAGQSSTDESDVSGKLALRWDVADGMMLYASYAEGYKAPGFDLIFGSTAAGIAEPVPPETSEAWETGMKAELLDNRLRMGLTLFHTTFSDLQGQATPPDGIGFQLISAGTAITKGVELDLTAKPTRNLLVNAGLAYTDAYYDEYTGAQCYPGQTAAQGCIGGAQNLAGVQIANAPKWKYSIQSRYDIELDLPFDLFVGGTYRWQDDSPGSLNNDPRTYHDSYGVLDFSAGVQADDRRWNVNWFVKNALDDHYVDLKANFTTVAPGAITHYLSRDAERYMGIEAEFRFGNY